MIESLSGAFADTGAAVFRNRVRAIDRVNARGGVAPPGGARGRGGEGGSAAVAQAGAGIRQAAALAVQATVPLGRRFTRAALHLARPRYPVSGGAIRLWRIGLRILSAGRVGRRGGQQAAEQQGGCRQRRCE